MKKILTTLICFTVLTLAACGGNSERASNFSETALKPAPTSTTQSINGLRANYSIRNTTSGFMVTESSSNKVTNIPSNVTNLVFADVTVNLQIAKKATLISANDLQKLEELYVAFFNRVPDANGLSYWIDQMQAGSTVNQIAENFYRAALLYPKETGYSSSMSTADFIKIIYKNVLGRTSVDQAGLDYWTTSLNSGKETRSSLVATILYSAHTFKGDATYGYVADLLDNKITIANYFAVQQGMGYLNDTDSITNGMKIAAAVTSTDVATAKKLILVGNDANADIFSLPVVAVTDVSQILKNAQSCPDGSSTDPASSVCLRGAASGTTSFGNTSCSFSVSADGTITLGVGSSIYQLLKPYEVVYVKSTFPNSNSSAYFLSFVASVIGPGSGQRISVDLNSPGVKAFGLTPSLKAEVIVFYDQSKNASCTIPLPV